MLGDEVRRAREGAGLTQEALAARARVDRSYLSEIERDKVQISVVVLLQVCRAMGVKASEIIARVEGEKQRR
jgi:transcriptional regulator with XRE-family HTH domain